MERSQGRSSDGARTRAWGIGLGAWLLLYLSWQQWHWLPGGLHGGQLFLPPVDAAAVVAALLAARRCAACGRLQWFWRLIAAACAAQLAADALTAVNALRYASPPFPSWADACFLAGFAFVFAALVYVPANRSTRSQRLRMLIDGATVVLGGGIFVWYFLLGPTIVAGAPHALAAAVSIAYPVCDLLLLAGLSALLLRHSPATLRTPLLLIAAGVLTAVVADTIYGAAVLNGTYHNGDPVDTLYLVEFMAFALAAASQRPLDPALLAEGRAQRRPAIGTAWLPYAALALGFGLALGVALDDAFFPDFSLLAIVVVLATLVAARQLLVQRELLRVQRKLSESERRFRAIFDTAAVGITYNDLDGPAIVDANATFARMVGTTPEQLCDRGYDAIAAPEFQGADRALAEAVRSGAIDQLQQELGYRAADGTTRWAMLTVSTVRDRRGAPTHVVCVFEDITRRRAAERMKDELVSVVGHELRTPLTSIRGALGLLSSGVLGELPGEAGAMVGTAISNTDRLTRLVNATLDVERMEAGGLELVSAPVAARTVVAESLQAVQAAADAAGVGIDADVEPLTLDGDGDRLVQVLVNLLGNAIKFSPPAGTVTVCAREDDGAAHLTVHDDGRGIPADQLEAIFERFRQVDASDAREMGGTGLGLPIARGIVEAHGGRIWADSRPGEGTTLHLALPLAHAEQRTTLDEAIR